MSISRSQIDTFQFVLLMFLCMHRLINSFCVFLVTYKRRALCIITLYNIPNKSQECCAQAIYIRGNKMKILIKAKDIYVEYSGKTILDIKDLEVFDYDRIGIVGSNGSGKSTLIKILLKKLTPQEGTVDLYGDFQYISQLTSSKVDVIEDLSRLSHFDGLEKNIQSMSGGESTRLKIEEALLKVGIGIIADEPTSFLDAEGVGLLLNEFKYFPGAIITASHDRYFLDELVNQIWEIRDGELRVYFGNYNAYKRIKDAKVERDKVE